MSHMEPQSAGRQKGPQEMTEEASTRCNKLVPQSIVGGPKNT